MLSLHAGAAAMGEAVQIEPGESLLLGAQADVNLGLDELERLSWWFTEGRRGHQWSRPRRGRASTQPGRRLLSRRSAVGSNKSVAHSAPVYVTVGGAKHTWHAPSVPTIVDRMEARLRDLIESTLDQLVEDFERWDVEPGYYSAGWKCCPSSRYGLTRRSTAMSGSAPWHRQVARRRGSGGRDSSVDRRRYSRFGETSDGTMTVTEWARPTCSASTSTTEPEISSLAMGSGSSSGAK